MASQLRPGDQIGNFKPPRKDRGHRQSNAVAERPGMDPKHLENIRRLPCCLTLRTGGVQAHHLKSTGAKERGIGIRSTDKWAIPLNADDHINGVERVGARNELKWFEARGIDALTLAAALWNARGDFAKMQKIVFEHKNGRTV